MRAAFPGALVLVVVACSGAAPTILDGPHDGGTGGESGSGSSSGSSGGHDAMPMGDDETDATTMPPQDAALDVHEAAVPPACIPSPPDGGACNSIVAPASSVTVDCNATDPVPAPLGGAIHDGTYRLISATYYADGGTCPTPETDGVTWDICGASWQISQNDSVNGAPQPALIANATVVTTGSSLAITLMCGLTVAPLTFAYDADATTLRLHTGGTATAGRIDTFARQ